MEPTCRLALVILLLGSGFSQQIRTVAGTDSNTEVTTETNLKSIAETIRLAGTLEEVYQNITSDPGVVARFYEANVYHAQLNDTLPTNPLLAANPFLDRVKLGICPRADVYKCLYYGNSSNGLPKSVQGVWWQDGIKFDEELISSAGEWDPVLRRLTIPSSGPRNWAAHDDSSVKAPGGLFWLPSGAAHMNWIISVKGSAEIYFNEDYTFGQILASGIVGYFFKITIPAFLVNWTMELLPDGSWLRKSTTLGLPTPSGEYFLRSVVTGEGKPGPYYEQFVKSREGRPFVYFQ